MNFNENLVFIPVSDIDGYMDYDVQAGYGQVDQLFFDDGIVVKKEDEAKMRGNIKDFEEGNY